jgi:hypothetical protein
MTLLIDRLSAYTGSVKWLLALCSGRHAVATVGCGSCATLVYPILSSLHIGDFMDICNNTIFFTLAMVN